MKKMIVFVTLLLLALSGNAQDKPYKAYVVSNAHFDTQWNWTVQTSIDEYLLNTMTQNLYLLDTYPEYIFNFEGGVKYRWMKEYYPELYKRVKDYILSGRWHITGSSWDATDPNVPSPESFFRNIMYGQHYYRDEFGPQYMSKDIFLPDCFGFSYTLPTIASHCGLIGFSTQKLQWRTKPFYADGKKVPFGIGLWKGIDGSQILACLDARGYTQKWDEDISYDKNLSALAEESGLNIAYRYYGTGDIGGSPSIGSVESVIKGAKGNGQNRIIISSSDRIMEEYHPFDKHPELPVYDGELLMDVHATGVYTSQAAMKRFNRRNEQLGDAAERASVVADWFGGLDYQHSVIDEAWKRVIWHQFHDDLTGTSIPKAYEFSWNDELISQSQFADVVSSSAGVVSKALETNVKGCPILVYNPTAFNRSDLVTAEIPFEKRPGGIAVYGPDGKRVRAQITGYNNGIATIIFAAKVKPMSFSVFDIRESSPEKGSLKITSNTLENKIYKVTLDKNGDISSIIDKRYGKELIESGKSMRLAYFEENKSTQWPAWEIIKNTIDAEPVSVDRNVRMSVAEQGPVRATIKVERTKDESTFVQYISLTEGVVDDRVTILNEYDWNSSGKLLKAEFPMSVSNGKATYDTGIGSIQRGTNIETAYEIIGHQWADITAEDGSYGISILNDCKYGWDMPRNNTLRLTLLHTPETSNRYTYQNRQDIGHHTFTYAIVGHAGDYHSGNIVRNAEAMNQPLMAFYVSKHSGVLGREYSMIKSIDNRIDVRAFKKAQDDDSYVIRVYETSGEGVENAGIVFNAEIVEAKELNGIEQVKGDAFSNGNTLYISASKFQPKTYSVKFKKAPVSVAKLKTVSVPLKFNSLAWTIDDFRTAWRFDSKGNSYAAELIPEAIDVNGIRFEMGPKTNYHALRCKGDTLVLPAGHQCKKLYMLMAAADTNRVATIKVDDKEYQVNVPYYSGFFGQWGHTGHTEGFITDAKLGYVGTHRHNGKKNEPYTFTYMYLVSVDVEPNSKYVYLPENFQVALFAATLSDGEDAISPASEIRAVPVRTAERGYETSPSKADRRISNIKR